MRSVELGFKRAPAGTSCVSILVKVARLEIDAEFVSGLFSLFATAEPLVAEATINGRVAIVIDATLRHKEPVWVVFLSAVFERGSSEATYDINFRVINCLHFLV